MGSGSLKKPTEEVAKVPPDEAKAANWVNAVRPAMPIVLRVIMMDLETENRLGLRPNLSK